MALNQQFKSGATSSSLTEFRKDRVLYANYIIQQQKLQQGCQSRVQLGNEPGAVNSRLLSELKKGAVYTTITEQISILAENNCPLIATVITNPSDNPIFTYETIGVAQWATLLDSTGNDLIRGIECDSDNNVYVTGQLIATDVSGIRVYDASGTTQALTFYTIPYVGAIPNIGFVAKYNTNGNCQWISATRRIGSSSTNYNIVCDSSNNVYIVGDSGNNTVFLDASGFTVTQSPVTNASAILGLFKLNSDGITQWVTGIPLGITSRTPLLSVDKDNNIYYGGPYSWTGADRITLLDASGITQINSLYSLPQTTAIWWFIIKVNSEGKTLWASYIPSGTNTNDTFINGITTDANNNVYYAVSYTNNITIPEVSGYVQTNSAYTLNATLQTAGLIKYNSAGTVQWCVDLNSSANDVSRGVAIDSENNIYWIGTYRSNTGTSVPVRDVSGTTQTNSLITLRNPTGTNNGAVFIIKYNADGKALWATCCDQAITGEDLAFKVKIDSLNNVYVCGLTNANGTFSIFDASGTTQTPSAINIPIPATTGQAAFLVKYNSAGIAQWATYLNGVNNGDDRWYGLAIDKLNSVYVGGISISTVTVQDVSGTTQNPSAITITPINDNTMAASFIKYR